MHTGLDCFSGAYDGKILQMILYKSELIAQRLSAEPKENSMKYQKQGPHEFVLFEYSEVTMENTKCACKVHYLENLTTSNILVFEQGPSCSRFDQIPCFKVIYVCLVMLEPGKSTRSETLELHLF